MKHWNCWYSRLRLRYYSYSKITINNEKKKKVIKTNQFRMCSIGGRNRNGSFLSMRQRLGAPCPKMCSVVQQNNLYRLIALRRHEHRCTSNGIITTKRRRYVSAVTPFAQNPHPTPHSTIQFYDIGDPGAYFYGAQCCFCSVRFGWSQMPQPPTYAIALCARAEHVPTIFIYWLSHTGHMWDVIAVFTVLFTFLPQRYKEKNNSK